MYKHNFTKSTLKETMSKIFNRVDIDIASLDSGFCKMSKKQIIKSFIKEYSNDKILNYVQSNLKPLPCFIAAKGTDLHNCLNSLGYAYPNGSDSHPYVPTITDELACGLGYVTKDPVFNADGNQFARMYCTYITESGKIIVTQEWEYRFNSGDDYIIFGKKKKGEQPCLNHLQDLVQEQFRIWD